jgi:hypothetical protein
MGGRLSQLGLVTVALVTLSCSGRDARAFALCNGCPELFASTPAAPIQKVAPPQHRLPSARRHAHHAELGWHQRRNGPPAFATAGRASLKAFAESTDDVPSSPPTDTAMVPEDASAPVGDQSPAPATDQPPPATPAARIDQLFNMLAVGPSDRPEDVAASRDDVIAQLIVRRAAPADDGTVLRLQTAIAFAVGSLLTGAALALARRRLGFAPPGPPDRRHRSSALGHRARRLKQFIRHKSHPLWQSARRHSQAA